MMQGDVIDMVFFKTFVIASVLLVIGIEFSLFPGKLPHPACHHRVHTWTIHEKPGSLEGPYQINTALQSAKRYFEGKIEGSESVALTPDGDRFILADKFGRIFLGRVDQSVQPSALYLDENQPHMEIPGRPLGVHALDENRILVCSTSKGLLNVDLRTKSFKVLSKKAKTHSKYSRTEKIVYANDLDVTEDGKVYFTDSTDIPVDKGNEGFYSTLRTYILDLLEGHPTGRLLEYDFMKNTTTELMPNLWYANGVAASKNGSFVAVVETNGFRVFRYWLKGPRAKTKDILISNLPGMPDGISTAPDGNFWIALVSPSVSFWNLLRFKTVRYLYAWFSSVWKTMPLKKWGYVLKVTPEGEVLTVLVDLEGYFINSISSAVERNSTLFLGNLVGDYVSIFDLRLTEASSKDNVDRDEL